VCKDGVSLRALPYHKGKGRTNSAPQSCVGCALAAAGVRRAAAVGTGQIAMVEFTRIKNFPLFRTVVPCQELQKAAVVVLRG